MGAKRPRRGQPFFLHFTCWLILAFTAIACLHVSGSRQGELHLASARDLLAGGDYQGALMENYRVLANDAPDLTDRALFQIGLIYAHPKNPDRNYPAALESFQRIVHQFPESPLSQDAEIWSRVIGLIIDQQKQAHLLWENNAILEKQVQTQKQKISRLIDQLEKLKNIDIKIEEKKSKVMPPAEDIKEKENGKDSGN